ncbi:MAG: hypothetical protein ACFFCW_33420 [Candidatus Hodarchaeota archaeon]
MLSEKGIKRLTGFLFLFILATSALSGGLAVELNADPDQIANTLHNITEDPEKYRISITFDLVSHMARARNNGSLARAYNNTCPVRTGPRGCLANYCWCQTLQTGLTFRMRAHSSEVRNRPQSHLLSLRDLNSIHSGDISRDLPANSPFFKG